jgi:plasmid stabilization system protein ParE
VRIEFSAFVENDLTAIADYIAQDNSRRAVEFIREIRGEMRAIAKNPLLYRLRPEIGAEARLAIIGRYVILFRIQNKIVRVERIVFGGRDLPLLLQ